MLRVDQRRRRGGGGRGEKCQDEFPCLINSRKDIKPAWRIRLGSLRRDMAGSKRRAIYSSRSPVDIQRHPTSRTVPPAALSSSWYSKTRRYPRSTTLGAALRGLPQTNQCTFPLLTHPNAWRNLIPDVAAIAEKRASIQAPTLKLGTFCRKATRLLVIPATSSGSWVLNPWELFKALISHLFFRV